MPPIDIVESGLTFRFDDNLLFRPEQEPLIARLHGVKKCDFVVCHNERTLSFIEVQNSAPSPTGDPRNVRAEMKECCDKFLHSLLLCFSHICGRVRYETFPVPLSELRLAAMPIRFILLVPGFSSEGCMLLQSILQTSVTALHRSFRRIEAFVVNRDNAHRKGIILVP